MEFPTQEEDFRKELELKSGKIAIVDAELLTAIPDLDPNSVIVVSTKSDQPFVVEGTYSDLTLEQLCVMPSEQEEEIEGELEIAETKPRQGGVRARNVVPLGRDTSMERKMRAIEDPAGNQAQHNKGDTSRDKLAKRGPHVHRKPNKNKPTLTNEEKFLIDNVHRDITEGQLVNFDFKILHTILEDMFYMSMGGWVFEEDETYHRVKGLIVDSSKWTVNEDTFLVNKGTGNTFPIRKNWIFEVKSLVENLMYTENTGNVESIIEDVRKKHKRQIRG